MNCKNCEHIVDGKFCSNCGQNANVGRISFLTLLNEISEAVFQINKGFFFTVKEIFVSPGSSINAFLAGKRKKYVKPIAYALTLSTVYFLISQFTNQNTWIDDLISGWVNGAIGENKENKIPRLTIWLSKNYAYTTLILLPIYSLASYLSFKKI